MTMSLSVRCFPIRASILLAICAVSNACSSPTPSTEIANKEDGWTYSIPAMFVKTDGKLPNGMAIPDGFQQYMGPEEEDFKTNIVIGSRHGDESAEQVGLDSTQNTPSGFVVQQNERYDIGESDGYTVRATRNHGKETQRAVFVKNGDVCVIFTLSSATKTFGKWDAIFGESLKTFRWTKPAK